MQLVPIAKAGFGQNAIQIPGLAQSNIAAGDRYEMVLEAETGVLRVTDKKADNTLLVAAGVWMWLQPEKPKAAAATKPK